MKKRITSLVLVLCMLLSMTMTVSFATTTDSITEPVRTCDGNHPESEGWIDLASITEWPTGNDGLSGKYYLSKDLNRSGITRILGDFTLFRM